jgi:hypothetical protein
MFAVYIVKQHILKMKENEWKGTTLFLKLSRIPCSVYVRVQVHRQVLSSALYSGLVYALVTLSLKKSILCTVQSHSYGTVCAGSGLTPWCMKGVAGCSAFGSWEQVFCGRVMSVCVLTVVHLMPLLTFTATHCMLLMWITQWFPSDQCCSAVQVFS